MELPKFAQSGAVLAPIAALDVSRDGERLRALTSDPQIHFKPRKPIAAGWCRVIAHVDGEAWNPRVYFDFGEGMSEAWSFRLEVGAERHLHYAVVWLPAPAIKVRLDPTDRPGRFRFAALLLDSLDGSQAIAELSRAIGPTPVRRSSIAERMRHVAARRARRALYAPLEAPDANSRLVYSAHSHFSGISLLLDHEDFASGILEAQVHEITRDGLRLLRSPTMDSGGDTVREWRHLYWDPIPDSASRFYLVRVRLRPAPGLAEAPHARLVRDAMPIHSQPEGFNDLPHAVVFSPVTQCNLNCTHCISRPTRTRLSKASERAWEAVAEVAKQPYFVHLATDYSGDILFDEVRHGGTLSRIIAMDCPFRIDTNANCLDEAIVERLVASRLTDINFSIDSMDPVVYAAVRRGSIPLAEVLGKIAHFMARRRESAPHIRTIISFVLMRSNAATIEPVFDFAAEHGIENVNVVPMIAFTPDMVDEILIWDTGRYAALYEKLTAAAQRTGIRLNMQAPVETWQERDSHAPCNIAWGSTILLGNGDVMACCVPGTRIGNIADRSLREIWNGPEYRAFRARVNTPDPPEPCRNCPMNRVANNRKAFAPARYGCQAHPIEIHR